MLKFSFVSTQLFGIVLCVNFLLVVLLHHSESATNVQEVCRLETMEGRCRWNSEVIVMTSARWGRMKTGRCLEEQSSLLALHQDDPLFLGCYEDVLSVLDAKCSGRSQCDVQVPNALDHIKPCYSELARYLEVSYTCVKVVQESRRCVVSVTTEAQFISSSSSSTSSDVNSVSSCGSTSHPWRLEAAAGQRINISLLDFTAMSMSADRPRDRVTCRQYGYVLEKWNKRNVSVCGGGGAQLRQSHVLISHSNDLQIVQTPSTPTSDNDENFLIKVEAVGCTNMIPPENAWLRRSNNDIIIGCYSSQQTWQLKCDGREWKGLVGTCPEFYEGTIASVKVSEKTKSSYDVLLIMVAIAGVAIALCFVVVCIGCCYLKRYRRDAVEKLKMSKGGATDVYLSNSRCVINNDKPVDNNVFTGRLPVSAGPQHHQWQQHHQQLLMQDDENVA